MGGDRDGAIIRLQLQQLDGKVVNFHPGAVSWWRFMTIVPRGRKEGSRQPLRGVGITAGSGKWKR